MYLLTPNVKGKKMKNYEGVYKVVHKEWNQSLPQLFETFQEAFNAQQKWDTTASIEQMIGDTVDVVWQPDYENFVSNVYFG